MKRIPLTQGKCAIVDDEDFGWLNQWKWYPTTKRNGVVYASRRDGTTMHSLLIACPKGLVRDHCNRNGLDNRKENLRLATHSQNRANSKNNGGSSRFRGVHWSKTERRWVAKITHRGKGIFLGQYRDEFDAAAAYNRAAQDIFGEYASLNDIK